MSTSGIYRREERNEGEGGEWGLGATEDCNDPPPLLLLISIVLRRNSDPHSKEGRDTEAMM